MTYIKLPYIILFNKNNLADPASAESSSVYVDPNGGESTANIGSIIQSDEIRKVPWQAISFGDPYQFKCLKGQPIFQGGHVMFKRLIGSNQWPALQAVHFRMFGWLLLGRFDRPRRRRKRKKKSIPSTTSSLELTFSSRGYTTRRSAAVPAFPER